MNKSRSKRLAGYALLEALVAVVVASVGFIGAARMQTVGMKMGASTQLRQKAVLLTYQMADRIRANRVGYGAHAYDNVAAGALDCLATGCTPGDLAVADMTEWSNDLAGQLPGGVGAVCLDSVASSTTMACDGLGNVLAIKVSWTDSLGQAIFVTAVRP